MKKIFLLIGLISIGAFSQTNPSVFKNGIDTKLIALDTLTTVQRDALTLKASKGYVIFNATTNTLNVHNGTSWGEVTGGGGATNLSTTQTPTTVVINSDTGTDAPISLGNGTNAGVSINDYTNADKALVASALQSADLSNYVTTNTTQTLTGTKTFNGSTTTFNSLNLFNGNIELPNNTYIGLGSANYYEIFANASEFSEELRYGINRNMNFESGGQLNILNNDVAKLNFNSANGKLRLHTYGGGINTGTATYGAAFDSSGNLIEVTLGSGGSGNVSNTGTPLANQIGIWVDDTTLKGDTNFTYNSTTAILDIGQSASEKAEIRSNNSPIFDYDNTISETRVLSQNFGVANTTNVNFSNALNVTVPTATSSGQAVNKGQLDSAISAAVIGVGTGATPIEHTFTGGETSYNFGTTITSSHQIAYGTTTSPLLLYQEGVHYSVSGSTATFIGFTAAANDVIVLYPNVAVPINYNAGEVAVAPSVNGNTDAQSVLEDHETRIDVLETGGSSTTPYIKHSCSMGAGINRYYYTKSPEFSTNTAFYATSATNVPAYNLGGNVGVGLPILDNKTITSIKGDITGEAASSLVLYFVKKHQEFITADLNITTGITALTSTTYVFTAGDVGKTIRVVGAGASGAVLSTTISAYVSPSEVTLATAAGTTVTNADGALETNTVLYTSSSIAFKAYAPTEINITGISFDLVKGDKLIIANQDAGAIKNIQLSIELYE